MSYNIWLVTYQLKPNFMDSFNFWHGHICLFLDFELELLSLSCLLRLKISFNNELFLESLFLWLLFLLQLCVQLSELFSTAFNSRKKKTVKLLRVFQYCFKLDTLLIEHMKRTCWIEWVRLSLSQVLNIIFSSTACIVTLNVGMGMLFYKSCKPHNNATRNYNITGSLWLVDRSSQSFCKNGGKKWINWKTQSIESKKFVLPSKHLVLYT